MNFAHYTLHVPYDALAENLVNSYDVSLPEPEHLRSVKDLHHFMTHHGVEPGRLSQHDLGCVRALRAATRDVFEAGNRRQTTRRVNALLDGGRYAAKLSARDIVEVEWRISVEADAATRLQAAVALNLAALLEAVGFDRYRVCRARPCRDVFIDLSKKGSRLFCGPRCASRVHVARFRSRTRK